MNKIINDIRAFWFFITAVLLCVALLILSLRFGVYANITALITLVLFWGTLIVLVFLGFLFTFEMITFYEDRVVSVSAFRCIELFYDEIANITYVSDKRGIGAEGVESVWEVTTFSKKSLCIIQTKRRKKIIERLQQKAKIGDGSVDI